MSLNFKAIRRDNLSPTETMGTLTVTDSGEIFLATSKSQDNQLKISDVLFVSTLPTSGQKDKIYLNLSDKKLYYFDTVDANWIAISGGGGDSYITALSNRIIVENDTNEVEIGIPNYNKNFDTIFVFQNSTFIAKDHDYIVSTDSLKLAKKSGQWIGNSKTILDITVLKNINFGDFSDISTDNLDQGLIRRLEEDNLEINLTNVLSLIYNDAQNGGGSSNEYTDYQISLLQNNIQQKIDDKANTIHDHDDKYYQKYEIDNNINSIVNALQDSQHKIKVDPNDEPSYLSNKVDNVTLTVESNELKVKNIDGLTIGVAQLNTLLSGSHENIQVQLDNIKQSLIAITSGMNYLGKVENYATLQMIGNKQNGNVVVVLNDENKSGGRSMYVYLDSTGSWDFIGEFTFTDEFIALQDTPNSYIGQDGKFVRVDETSNKLIFNDVNWSDLKNKPSSTITQIDNSVSNSHNHHNKEILDTYTQSNTDLANAVANSHNHQNKTSLDKLGVNVNDELTINGEVYPVFPQREYLYVRRTSTNQQITANSDLIFNSKVNGNIPYNTSTGVFTLTKGKVYRISVNPLLNLTSWVRLSFVDATTNTSPTESLNDAVIDSVSSTLILTYI